MTTKIPAVAYYRMSSDKQETSIDDQRTSVEQYALDRGYRIVREYVDEGISGWKAEQRKGFQRLISDAEKGADFEAVLCWDQDRFSRFPVLEANHYWFLLDRAGIHISTVAQGRLNFEDLGEWLKASVVQHGKAEYLRDLSRNTTRGMRKKKLAGQWFGKPPIGYRVSNDGKLELGADAEVAIVRRVFELRSQGYGLYVIAKDLNARRVESPRGGKWHPNSILHLLKRETYLGHTVIGKFARSRYMPAELVRLENTHPAIIDIETWNATRSPSGQQRRAHTRNGSQGAPLSGLCYCGRCGSPMYAVGGDKYVCGSYQGRGECGYCAVPRVPLMAAIAFRIRERVLLGSIDRLEAAVQRELDRRNSRVPDSSADRRKLQTLDKQIERASRRILAVDDSLVANLETQLLEMKAEREQLSASIGQSLAPARLPSAKAIAAKAWELDRIVAQAPATAVRQALRQVVERIDLDFESAGRTYRGETYRFTGGTIRLHTKIEQPGTAL